MLKALKALTGVVASLLRRGREAPKAGALRQAPQGVGSSHMYMVTELGPDRFLCEVMVQDGHERWHERSLEEAEQAVVRAAKWLNGVDIGIDRISRRRSATA